MLPPSYQARPLLCTWADTRKFAGTAAGVYGSWVAGIWPSWSEATKSADAGCFSGGALDGDWGWRTGLRGKSYWGATYDNAPGVLPSGSGLIYQDTGASPNTIYLCDQYAIYPSRALRDDPIPIDIVDGGVVVTLGGLTVRNTHSYRRQWVLDLLLDGALDVQSGAGGEWASAPDLWKSFVRRADIGVTVYLYGTEWQTPGRLSPAWAYAGAPNRISGALVDATNIRWTPPQTGILSRYEVSITIAEVSAPGRV